MITVHRLSGIRLHAQNTLGNACLDALHAVKPMGKGNTQDGYFMDSHHLGFSPQQLTVDEIGKIVGTVVMTVHREVEIKLCVFQE